MTQKEAITLTGKKTGVGIRSKLLSWMLLIALVPLIIISVISYFLSADALQKQSFDSLESTLVLQKKSLDDYFSERVRNLKNLVEDVQVLQQEEFSKMAAIKSLKKKQVENFFISRLQDVTAFSSSPQQRGAYENFSSKTSYDATRKKFINFYNTWLKKRNFHSLIMVDRGGDVVFSNDESIVVGSSFKGLKGGPEIVAYENGLKKVSFTDFGKSPLRQNRPAAYFSAPVKNGGRTTGVMLFYLNSDSVDALMKNNVGLGTTGESYLIGEDRMFRSNSIHFEENIVVSPAFLADTDSVDAALNGSSGETVLINYRGEYVLSSYVPVKIAEITWAMIVEVDLSEAMAPKQKGKGLDYLAGYAKNYGYPDLYLLDIDGYIFYSAKQKLDFQTNILSGPYADSAFAETVTKVLESKKIVVSDYSRYQPAEGKPSAFLAIPVMAGDTIQMVVALQVPIDQISAIMKERSGLGETGDTYLIGPDKLWRTESFQAAKYGVDSTLLNPKAVVDTESVQEALAGRTGTKVTKNGVGRTVLASWAPFTFHGLKWAIVNEIEQAEIAKPVSNLFKFSAFVTVAGIIAVFFLSLLVSGGITRQVKLILNAMNKVENGDFDAQVKVVSSDELGVMAASFNEMIGTTQGLMKTREDEHEQLQESIMGLLMEISDLSEGDLTVRATVNEDATGTVADSLNMMLEELGSAIGKIKQSSEEVGATADQLSLSTGKLAARSDSQFALIKGAVSEIKQMTSAIEQAAIQANTSANTSELSRKAATEGTKAVEETSRAMDTIRGNVQDTARAIKRLGESSQEISDFAKTINDISDRTSILALNASIQAAAAGEEGRGFAVVAEEIQRLAERAAASTRQIETLIKNILGEITDAGASMDYSIQEVVKGTALSDDALAKLQDINKRSTEVAELIGAVSLATIEQTKNSLSVAKTMDEIGIISKKTAEVTRLTSSSMHGMAVVADEMLQSVSTFKLPDTTNEVMTEKVVEVPEEPVSKPAPGPVVEPIEEPVVNDAVTQTETVQMSEMAKVVDEMFESVDASDLLKEGVQEGEEKVLKENNDSESMTLASFLESEGGTKG
jgi:methyl-accepting chemotaxis protein